MLTGGRDDREDNLPDESEEVHDVVSTGRHLLLSLLSLLLLLVVVSCGIIGVDSFNSGRIILKWRLWLLLYRRENRVQCVKREKKRRKCRADSKV